MHHKHHIIPKHAGGTDHPDNLVELSVEDHAIAHKLLYEQYGRWEDKLAWEGLSNLKPKAEIVLECQRQAGRKGNEKLNPGKGVRTKTNWALDPSNQQAAVNASKSDQSIAKRKATMKENCHQQGAMNSMAGTRFYTKDGISKRFQEGTQPDGWILNAELNESLKSKTRAYGYSWYNDSSTNFFLKPGDERIIGLNLVKGRKTA